MESTFSNFRPTNDLVVASIMVRNKNNVWVEDNMVTKCRNFDICKTSFNYYYRKHHCRNCGNVFCYQCVNQEIIIPDFILDKPEPADYWNPSYYIPVLKKQEQKVCDQCFRTITNKTNAENKIIQTLNNTTCLNEINNLNMIDENIREHYLDHLRNIQYYLPNHTYDQIDKKILRDNARDFSSHSKYIAHLIKSIDWNSVSNAESEQVLKILNGDKKKSCGELFCTRTCQEKLSFDDCVNILYSSAHSLPESILVYIFSILKDTTEEIIICHLPFFVTLIKNTAGDVLRNLLGKFLGTSMKLIYFTYWLLITEKNDISAITTNTPDNIHKLYNYHIDEFFNLFDTNLINKLRWDYDFYVNLITELDDPGKFLIENFDKYKPIALPYNPEIQLIGVYIEEIEIKKSHSNPVIIKFETKEHGAIRILFKRESVTNDLIVLNLISLCDIILSESLDINFGAITYPVMPITSNGGMIEMVDDADTLYAICAKKKPIWQHIFEKNESKTVSEIMTTYMHSLVSYTLHSYFIGLGDRHLENIMISNDGKIFHIDFGFILGTDSHPITSTDIKLNADMLGVIGSKYPEYLNLCRDGTIIIRKFFNMFFILLSGIKCSNINEVQIKKFVMGRFQPRQTDEIVFTELLSIIEQSNNNFTDIIRDFIHFHSQEKTIQNGISRIINSASGVVNVIKTFGESTIGSFNKDVIPLISKDKDIV